MSKDIVKRPDVGRPTKLTPHVIEEAFNYLVERTKEESKKLPTLEGLARWLNISRDTLYAWEKESEQFSYIVSAIRQEQAEILIQKGLSGEYNASITKLLLSKHGYVEKSEVDQNIHMPTPILGGESRKVIDVETEGEVDETN